MTSSLMKSAAGGTAWFGIAQVMNQGLRFGSMIILARLLFPEDFGAIAAAMLVADLVLRLGDLGFSEAIIQKKDINESHLSTSFWLGLATGATFCLITVAISPFAANFFNIELVGKLLAVASITFILAPLRSVHGSILRKRLQFFRFSLGEMGQGITYVIAAIAFAFAGFGAWSIVLASLTGHFVLVISRWILCPWRPSLVFSVASLKDLWGFGLNLTGSRVVQFLVDKLDYLIIGRFLSAASLGFYNIALRVAAFPTAALWMSVGRVAFPTFSVIQDEIERLRRGFARSLSYVAIIVFPLYVGLAVIAPEFTRVILGEKWIPAIIPMQIICFAAAIASLGATVGPLLRAKGRADIEFRVDLVRLALLVPSLLIAVRFGIIGVAVGVLVIGVVGLLIRQFFANRLVGLSTRDYLRALAPAALGSLVMALVLLAFRYSTEAMLNLSDIVMLIGMLLLGAVTYLVTLKVMRVEALDELIGLAAVPARRYGLSAAARISIARSKLWRAVTGCL